MRLIKKISLGLFIISGIAMISCSQEQTLGQVNLEAFKSDRGACKNLRQQDLEKLKAAQDALLGMSENEILSLLGRYDVQVLDRRQKKMFIYYLEKGIQCDEQKSKGFGRTMILRFNAVSLVNEVSFEVGLP